MNNDQNQPVVQHDLVTPTSQTSQVDQNNSLDTSELKPESAELDQAGLDALADATKTNSADTEIEFQVAQPPTPPNDPVQ